MTSWAAPWTANLAMVYGTCFNRIGPKPVARARGQGHPLAATRTDLNGVTKNRTGVEALDRALLLDEAHEAADKAGGEGRVGDAADTGGLERAEEDVGDELGAGGGSEVDDRLVVPRTALTEDVGGLDLEELDTSELEPTCPTTTHR
jgi:hypothetical protein